MSEEVFTRICEVAVECSTDFFTKHCQIFTDEEENRLEYKQVHDMYLAMLDSKFDEVLKEHFSDEEIAVFYNDFAHN